MLKAMSCFALRLHAMEAKERWAKVRVSVKMLPKIGRPLGPGIGTLPFWFLPFLHAVPPEESAHVTKLRITKADINDIATYPSSKLFELRNAGRVKIHQLVSLVAMHESIFLQVGGGEIKAKETKEGVNGEEYRSLRVYIGIGGTNGVYAYAGVIQILGQQ